jgi:hypothetical protein
VYPKTEVTHEAGISRILGKLRLEIVHSAGAICDQNSKLFLSHQKEFMAGHVGIKRVY